MSQTGNKRTKARFKRCTTVISNSIDEFKFDFSTSVVRRPNQRRPESGSTISSVAFVDFGVTLIQTSRYTGAEFIVYV